MKQLGVAYPLFVNGLDKPALDLVLAGDIFELQILSGSTGTCNLFSPTNFGGKEFAVHPGNIGHLDLFRAFCFAGVCIGAIAESQFIHFGHHGLDPFFGFRTALRQ